MTVRLDDKFLQCINENIGIAHKVLNVYFQDAEDREDAMQEMMYQLWRSYPNFNGRSKFSTWMYKVCLNTALTSKRHSKRRTAETLSPVHDGIAGESAESDHEALSMLTEAIAELSGLNKAIILLYLDDMSYDEIAAVLGLTRSNVSVRLVRIKKELETRLNKKIKSQSHVHT